MQLLKLVQNLVKLGEPLPWGVRDAQGNLLLAQGHVVATSSQLVSILERGAFVDVEEVKAAAKRTADLERQQQRPVNLFTLWERELWQLDRLLRSTEEPGFSERADELARHLLALTDRDADIAIYLCIRQDPKRLSIYGLAHAVHCALICLLVARRLGWDEAQVLTQMKAALTMNIATLELQGRLAVQGVPPTQSQQAMLAAHPARSAEMLRAAGVTDELWLQTVEQHHEKPDGSGYPARLQEVVEPACLLRHVDVFMAKISPRAMRVPLTTQTAARQLFQEDRGGPIAAAIVKEVGIFPPGELVQLKSGEHAVVVRRTGSASTPMVASITDRGGMPVVNTVVRDTSKPEFAIAATVADKGLVLRMPPERLYGLPE
ncbi:HD-GYP domain-containing protein [Piscinibacter sp.]|uniref:HD-GYP domain-containing protein n=1 Tax=Piscinibacter sp. TaxID=1903157 RepID=UPI002BE64167|nr:HD domain-containing phosphohydrolase [Albitalea sp.]HUG23833.1 HD domain-containing phosphohydrolase [Albitalea sp.]